MPQVPLEAQVVLPGPAGINSTINTKILFKITTHLFKDWIGKQMDGLMDGQTDEWGM